MGKQAPKPGDYQGAAQQTSASTRPDVRGPLSNTTWTTGPDGRPVVTQGVSGQVQNAFDSMRPFDLGSFGPIQSGDQAREATINSAWSAAKSRLDPQWQQRAQSMQVQLGNQGIDPNSQAARNARREQAWAQNDAYGQAMAGAVQQGNQAANSVFQNNMQAHQQSIANALRARQLPLDDLSALRGFMNPINYGQGADMLGALSAEDAARLRQWKESNAATADMLGGVFGGLGGLAGGLFGLGG